MDPSAYNQRNPAVKRLMREAMELKTPTELYYAMPLEDNLFEWHFTVRGPPETEFASGIYHGRIILPTEYPMKPPSIMLLTPNGRFEVNKKICLSISGYHPESWQPSWSIRTALLAIIGFMPTPGAGSLGSLDYTAEERKALAEKSLLWKCSACHSTQMQGVLLPITDASSTTRAEAAQLANQISFKEETPKNVQQENINGSESNGPHIPATLSTNSLTERLSGSVIGDLEEVNEQIRAVRQRLLSPGYSNPQALVRRRERTPANRNILPSFNMITVLIWLLVAVIVFLLLRRLYFATDAYEHTFKSRYSEDI